MKREVTGDINAASLAYTIALRVNCCRDGFVSVAPCCDDVLA